MTIRGVHHTAIIVRDLDRSIYFYHDVLGLELSQEPSDWMEGEALARGTGVPGARLRNALLRIGSDATLELLEYANRPADNDRPIQQNYLGAMHIALRVDDITAKKAELERHGVEFLAEVNGFDDGALAGWRWVYFHDPDGISLELVEVAYSNEYERRLRIEEYLATRPSLEALVD
ncbi:VOC family protein [Herbiconiux sp. UC225_62]|uniref:VOC family protein n=1 Tax=Herbiconiux sp. UC225_62 TaxID=3350168 RepID=UPI0036D25D86